MLIASSGNSATYFDERPNLFLRLIAGSFGMSKFRRSQHTKNRRTKTSPKFSFDRLSVAKPTRRVAPHASPPRHDPHPQRPETNSANQNELPKPSPSSEDCRSATPVGEAMDVEGVFRQVSGGQVEQVFVVGEEEDLGLAGQLGQDQ